MVLGKKKIEKIIVLIKNKNGQFFKSITKKK